MENRNDNDLAAGDTELLQDTEKKTANTGNTENTENTENTVPRIIAGLYRIERKIGAGGGGIVYLGCHLRLNKPVVLKADKRTLRARPELLSREVDILKELRHTYIPQVYDFVQQDGIVYTVMDFIEGESLDKMLGRGQMPRQPQVIKWSIQLLEALRCLHCHPPYGILHGDIKPANIMLRPNGDICLIDYNIALALGEAGAVRVGFSRGYASPEHYGIEFPSPSGEETRGIRRRILQTWESGNSSGRNMVMLDVRSDIYSLGATLYHLLSGRRPPQDARQVIPLGPDICSPAVSSIIQRAMAPSPDLRYQSAEEMLAAFRQLHKRDPRVIRRRRLAAASASGLILAFLAGGVCSLIGLKQMEQKQAALTLAEYSANAYENGDVSGAVELALQAIPREKTLLGLPVTAQAQKALTDALGVYDLSDGFHALDTIELPSAPFHIAMSPGGSCFAAVYSGEMAVYDSEGCRRLAVLPAEPSALSDVVFADETHVVYAGEQGVTGYDLEAQKGMWTGEAATTLAISGDGRIVAAVNRDEDHVSVYQVSDGRLLAQRSFEGQHLEVPANDSFADPDNHVFALNADGSLLAVSFSDGGLRIFDRSHPDNDLILYEESDYTRFQGGFSGRYFAFAANKAGESLFGLIDTAEGVYLGGFDSDNPLSLQADENGIYLSAGNLLVSMDPDTFEETELAYTDHVNITGFSVGSQYVLAAADDNRVFFFDSGANQMSVETGKENCDFLLLAGEIALLANRNEPTIRVLKQENYPEAQLLSYDPRYAHDEARISQDGKTVMLFDYQKFRVYDRSGRVQGQGELPDAEHIYDQQFVRNEEGSWLEVIWYDGTVRRYSAADGRQIWEGSGEPPASDLYEEFFTDHYRIASPLHGVPEVYDRKSGRKVGELEKDSYLTYVTQAGAFIITEYVSAEGERYGLLLNHELQTLAYLPGLCDVVDDMLIFDYKSGNLRQCRIYSLQELIALGEAYRK